MRKIIWIVVILLVVGTGVYWYLNKEFLLTENLYIENSEVQKKTTDSVENPQNLKNEGGTNVGGNSANKVFNIEGFDELGASSKRYVIENNKVFYEYFELGDSVPNREKITDDASTFKIIDAVYVSADNSIFWGSTKIDADPETFRVLRVQDSESEIVSSFAKDNKKVFLESIELSSADPETFFVKNVDGEAVLGFDKERVFSGSVLSEDKVMTGISPDSVKVEVGNGMGKIISDEDVSWYWRGNCHGGYFVTEEEMFEKHLPEDWTRERYLEEYTYC